MQVAAFFMDFSIFLPSDLATFDTVGGRGRTDHSKRMRRFDDSGCARSLPRALASI